MRPLYEVSIGDTVLDGAAGDGAGLIRLVCASAVGGAAPWASILLETDGEAPTFQIEDEVSVRLGMASGSLTAVFAGRVDAVRPSLTGTMISALSPSVDLLSMLVDETFERQSAGDIVRDLAGRAGLTAGTIDDGIEFASYRADDRKPVGRHLRELAARCGFDLYFDPQNAIVFAAFQSSSAVRTFEYGVDILSARIAAESPTYDKIEVVPESPASSEGEETTSWIAASPSDFTGSDGDGERVMVIRDRAIRTQEGAQQSAEGRLSAINRHATSGCLLVLGAADVPVGRTVEIRGTSDGVAGTYQVRSITHRIDHDLGFLSQIDLWGVTG